MSRLDAVANILVKAEDVTLPPGMALPEAAPADHPPDFDATELALADAAAAIIVSQGCHTIHAGDGFRSWTGTSFPKDPDPGPTQEALKAMVRRCGGT